MPTSQPIARSSTLKRAKAAFKARGRPTLSDAERRQLDRSIELDKRAWRTKEQEKRKAETARKRTEKERKEKEERQRAAMGSQMRCDRFGYKSSQFHLGAFFGAGAAKKVELEHGMENGQAEESFGDEGVDDETLLDALESPRMERKQTQIPQAHVQSDSAVRSVSQWPVMSLQRSMSEPASTIEDELGDFWDELGSSTQIARELSPEPNQASERKPLACTTSFGSGDFDLTEDDLDELKTPELKTTPMPSMVESDRKLMPPPTLPMKICNASEAPKPVASGTENDQKLMPPPTLPTKNRNPLEAPRLVFNRTENDRKLMPPPALPPKTRSTPIKASRQATSSAKPCGSPFTTASALHYPKYGGFTMTELEGFVDDDLQLTQVAPG